GHRYDNDSRRIPDPSTMDTRKLKKALHKLIRRSGGPADLEYLHRPLADFVRALLDAEPTGTTRVDVARMATRAEHPILDDTAITHLREVFGDLVDFAVRLDGTVGLPTDGGVNRDWARIIGIDTDSTELAERIRRYEQFRAGELEEYRDLTPEEREALDAEMRADLDERRNQYIKVYDAFRD
ncbi:hypothetical protein ACW9HQ_50460, partial [Nocardia gipuzkoensis]